MRDPLEHLRLPVVPVEPRPEFAEALSRRIRGENPSPAPATATVRYFVADLDAAARFYRELLGFEEELRPSPAFAMLYRGDLRLLLSTPGEAHALPGGLLPEPGGHNRIALRVEDLAQTVADLRRRGARFRTEISVGFTVSTALLEDPAGNPVELFEARQGYHERGMPRQSSPHEHPPSKAKEEEK